MNHTAPIGNKGVLATWRKNIPIRACYRAACAAAHRRSFRCNFGGTKFRPWTPGECRTIWVGIFSFVPPLRHRRHPRGRLLPNQLCREVRRLLC